MKNLKIFTMNIEGKALNQVHNLLDQEAFANSKVRIMPDVHAGAGCVVGFTADLGKKVIPNVVGVDIGCGMLTVNLGKVDIDLSKLDETIKKVVPSGFAVHENSKNKMPFDLNQLHCVKMLKNTQRIQASLGTLGGGNHFIEIDIDEEGNKYLIIHTGSRNLGKQVAEIYQDLAINKMATVSAAGRERVIAELKAQNRQREIPDALKALTPEVKVPKELAYLEGVDREHYLHDMRLCQVFAQSNRDFIAAAILSNMNLKYEWKLNTIHNYIGDDNIVRKGAISAYKDEMVLIPINMKDGCILGVGLGNEDWNYSAPHGAGRILSRSAAKETLTVEDFQDDMEGIYTTTANQSTIDESPRAYKPMEEIIENIKDTVKIIKILKPIYNFKASE